MCIESESGQLKFVEGANPVRQIRGMAVSD